MKINIEEVVRTYGDMILRLAVVNTKDRTAAEDVFQEVFLKLFRYQKSITCEEHLKSWLIKVTLQRSYTYTHSPWNTSTEALFREEDLLDEETEETMSDTEKESDVTRAVMGLPKKYKEVIHLFYYEELSVKEIAEILGEKEATIKTRLARGRSILEERLGEVYAL